MATPLPSSPLPFDLKPLSPFAETQSGKQVTLKQDISIGGKSYTVTLIIHADEVATTDKNRLMAETVQKMAALAVAFKLGTGGKAEKITFSGDTVTKEYAGGAGKSSQTADLTKKQTKYLSKASAGKTAERKAYSLRFEALDFFIKKNKPGAPKPAATIATTGKPAIPTPTTPTTPPVLQKTPAPTTPTHTPTTTTTTPPVAPTGGPGTPPGKAGTPPDRK